MLCTEIVSNIQNNFCIQHVLPRFELGIFTYLTCNSMKNLSPYCGLVDARIRASDKDLPVAMNSVLASRAPGDFLHNSKSTDSHPESVTWLSL